jgi:hypothetical protein
MKKRDSRRRHVREREELAKLLLQLREVDPVAFERKLPEIRTRSAKRELPGPLRKRAGFASDARFWRQFLRERLLLPLTADADCPFP